VYNHPIYRIVAIFAMCVLSNNAFALTCERTSRSAEGFTTSAAFDSWHPKEISGGHSASLVWEEAGKGSKALVAELSLGQETMRYRLLPNGKMIAKLVTRARYADTAHVRYKCDKNSNEVRQLLASGSAANTNSTNSSGSLSGDLEAELEKAKRMFPRHTEHALCHKATWVYENQLEFWQTNDFDGKYPQGAYASLLAQHLGYGCDVGIPEKDLVICHEAMDSDTSASSLDWADKNYEYYSDKDLAKQLRKNVNRAKDMGLNCLAQKTADKKPSIPTTSTSSSKLDKAKSTCTELGFTLGTEKHGDCVLKMMDN
jgi:hypothetical protein